MSVCVCNTGFIGFDCSVTLSATPTELAIPNKRLCSTKTRLCQKTNIFSISYSEKVYCKFQHFTASENGKQLTSGRGAIVAEAVYQYENMASCDIPTSRTDKSVDGYDLPMSYDGTNYGDSVSFIIYDEDCFACNATTVLGWILVTRQRTTGTETETNKNSYWTGLQERSVFTKLVTCTSMPSERVNKRTMCCV